MITYGDVLEESRQAFADGHYLQAHYALMTALYLAYDQGLTSGVRTALQQAGRYVEALTQQEASQAYQEMARFARGRAEFLYSRLRLAQQRTDAAAEQRTEADTGQRDEVPREAAGEEGA